jgi:hypothetical protein
VVAFRTCAFGWKVIISKNVIGMTVNVDVRCNAIEGISHRYHRCGLVCMLEVKDKCRGSSLQMAFRIFRCHRAFKTNKGSLDTSFGDLTPT